MRRGAAVGVDDDLAPRDAGVAVRTTDDESARRVVWRLAVDGGENGARFGVEPELAAVVADLVDRPANHFLKIDVCARRDLARDNGQAGGDERLARDAAHRILCEDRVEDRI